ncbi:hypothetical protein ATANTOWER_032661 [Ataeniobius toweri]|uniref:Secreted protein n=1 Tax=Ataeniobius toweri TaxID=208326 RepID=A0ABU7ACE9_9TELE|nr:hypothetical protein [Ataeniobius toweri]
MARFAATRAAVWREPGAFTVTAACLLILESSATQVHFRLTHSMKLSYAGKKCLKHYTTNTFALQLEQRYKIENTRWYKEHLKMCFIETRNKQNTTMIGLDQESVTSVTSGASSSK